MTPAGTVALTPNRRVPLATRLFYLFVAIVALGPAAFVVITPFDLQTQAIFGLFTAFIFLLVNRFKSRMATLIIVVLSALVSTRYLWWRTTETLGFVDPFDMMFGYGLFAAEVYAWIVLMIGYFQVLWPLDRQPAPLPADTTEWPTVDVYIPTYNESLDVVKPTVLAAMVMDYPADKFKVYILDDGRRPEFKRFAEECGCRLFDPPRATSTPRPATSITRMTHHQGQADRHLRLRSHPDARLPSDDRRLDPA
jgi:cellulose synthase (UDP-forming)